MISPEEFVQRWGSDDAALIRFPKAAVDKLEIPIEDREFLWIAGLPKSAAPFLGFDGHISVLPNDLLPSNEYRRVYIIGEGGCGDPIAIDGTAFGWIVELAHEFRFSRAFVNTSIRHLAACLLAFRDFVTDTQKVNGDDAYISGNIPPGLRRRVEEEIGRIDAPALDLRCFWREQLDATDYMIKAYRRPVADFSKGTI